MKKLLSIALSLCLLLSVALADGTLTKVYKTEDLVSNTFHNGFVTAIGMTGENTVVLKDDGTYEYTKRLMQTAEDGTVTADEAKAKIEPQKAELEAAAREVIEREGYDYPVSVNVVNEYFATRCYGSLTMPAGRYTAVKVVIGEGAGHNWWCVMFPPLCLPAAQDRGGNIDAFLDGDELKVVESSGRYEPRIKIVEIIEEFREKTSPEN